MAAEGRSESEHALGPQQQPPAAVDAPGRVMFPGSELIASKPGIVGRGDVVPRFHHAERGGDYQ